MRDRLFTFLLLLFLAAATGATTSCGSSGAGVESARGAGAAVDWAAYPVTRFVTYTPGTQVEAAHATIDAAGGTLSGPSGSPLAGVVVTFPAGALTAPTKVTLALDQGAGFANAHSDEHPLALSITSDGQREFGKPISVTFPFEDTTRFPVAYHVRDDGTLAVMPPLALDRARHRGGFVTYHLTKYVVFDPTDPRSEESHREKYTAFSGFLPAVDGFRIHNVSHELYTPAGRCQGMAAFALWFKTAHGGGLAQKYVATVPTKTLKDVTTGTPNPGQSGHAMISNRAQIATNLKAPPPSTAPLGDSLVTLLHALQTQPGGVLMGLQYGDANVGHVLVAIGANDTKIGVYDPNHPLKTMEMTYAFTHDEEGGKVSYDKGFDWFSLWGNGEIPPVGDDFARIYDDAEAGFHGENLSLVDVTSPTGTKVDSQDVSLEGKVQSGLVELSDLEVTIRYPDGTLSDPQPLALQPGQHDFTFPLKLRAGENVVLFKTSGPVVGGGKLRIPNTRADVPPDDWLKMTWAESPTPDNQLKVKYSRSYIEGDTRVDRSVELNASFKYTVNATLSAALTNKAFPFNFDNCVGAGGCTLIRGQTYAGKLDGTWLPIQLISNHEERYHRERYSGEWKLDSSIDAPRTVTCEWIGVYLFVEPGSKAGNYRYRFALKRAGNIRCKGPNQLPLLGESLEMDAGVAEECEQPPRVTPAEIEPWVQAPRGAKTLSLHGSNRCSGDGYSTTESASVTLTLVPCKGAPCM